MSETVSGTRRKLKTSATWKILGGPDHHHPIGIQSAPPGVRGVVRNSLGGLLHRRSEHGRETSSFVLPIRLVLSRAASVIEVSSLYAPETWTSSDFNPGAIQRRNTCPLGGKAFRTAALFLPLAPLEARSCRSPNIQPPRSCPETFCYENARRGSYQMHKSCYQQDNLFTVCDYTVEPSPHSKFSLPSHITL